MALIFAWAGVLALNVPERRARPLSTREVKPWPGPDRASLAVVCQEARIDGEEDERVEEREGESRE
jgi:hypothetical protein